MRKPPGSQPETDLLTGNSVDRDGSDYISIHFIWNHHQLPGMTTNHDGSPRLGVKVPLVRMTNNALKFRQVITSQRCPVLKVFSPNNTQHMTLTVLMYSASIT